MAKYGKNNYFNGVILPEPKEEMLRHMAKGVNCSDGGFSTTDPALRQTPFTIQCVIRPTKVTSTLQVAFNTKGDSTNPRVDLNWSGNIVIYGGGSMLYTKPANLDSIYDIVFVATDSQLSLFVDGTLITSVSYVNAISLYNIGFYSANNSLYFQGDYLLHRHFNYAMSADEVKALDNNGDPAGYILPQNLKNIKDMAFTSKTFEFDMDSPYYWRILESSELESGRRYRVDYVVEEWDIAPYVMVTCGISCGVIAVAGNQYWNNLSAAKLGENQYVVVDTKKTGTPFMFVYGSDPAYPHTSRRLKVTVHSVKMLGCVAEYLPQNLIPTAEGSVVQRLDSAPQLPEANGILPPLDASVGGYDLAAIGNPKIII